MRKITYSKMIGIIVGLSLVLVCSAGAVSPEDKDAEALFSNSVVMSSVNANVQNFTGAPVDAIERIAVLKTYVGDVYQVTTASGNLFNINVKTGEIETAIIQNGLKTSFDGTTLSEMRDVAETYAKDHYKNFTQKKMTLVQSVVIDHGDAGYEYMFSWNEKFGEAYSLSGVSISIYPNDNIIEYHGTDRELLIDTTPKISKTDARITGERAFGMGSSTKTQAKLRVILFDDRQKLAWIVNTEEYDKMGFAHGGTVTIDAISGEVLSTDPIQ
jgi:hypothetical protein